MKKIGGQFFFKAMDEHKIHGIKIKFPSDFNELSTAQFLVIMDIYYQKIDVPNAQFLILKLFFRHNFKLLWLFFYNDYVVPCLDFFTFRKLTFEQKVMNNNDWLDLFRIASAFLFKGEKYLTKQLQPFIKIRNYSRLLKVKIKLYGANDELRNITFKEFIALDFMYLMYVKTRQEKYLNKLCAIMYRPKNQPFDEHDYLLNTRAEYIGELPYVQRLAIFEYYNGCRRYITEKYSSLFPIVKEKDTKEPPLSVKGIIEQYEVWNAIPSEFSDRPDEVITQENVLLHTVLRFLNHKAKRNIELKDYYEKQKQK